MTDKNIQTLEPLQEGEFGNTEENMLNFSGILDTERPLNQPRFDAKSNLATENRLDFFKLSAIYSGDPALVQAQQRLELEPPVPKDTLEEFTDLKQQIFKNGKFVPDEFGNQKEKFAEVISKIQDEFKTHASDFENYLRTDSNLPEALNEYFSAQKQVENELDNLEEEDLKKVLHNVKHFFITRNPEQRLKLIEEIKENPKAANLASALEGFDATFKKHKNTLTAFDQASGSLFSNFEKTNAIAKNYLDLLKQYKQARPDKGVEGETQRLEEWIKNFQKENGYIHSLPRNLFNFEYVRNPVHKI